MAHQQASEQHLQPRYPAQASGATLALLKDAAAQAAHIRREIAAIKASALDHMESPRKHDQLPPKTDLSALGHDSSTASPGDGAFNWKIASGQDEGPLLPPEEPDRYFDKERSEADGSGQVGRHRRDMVASAAAVAPGEEQAPPQDDDSLDQHRRSMSLDLHRHRSQSGRQASALLRYQDDPYDNLEMQQGSRRLKPARLQYRDTLSRTGPAVLLTKRAPFDARPYNSRAAGKNLPERLSQTSPPPDSRGMHRQHSHPRQRSLENPYASPHRNQRHSEDNWDAPSRYPDDHGRTSQDRGHFVQLHDHDRGYMHESDYGSRPASRPVRQRSQRATTRGLWISSAERERSAGQDSSNPADSINELRSRLLARVQQANDAKTRIDDRKRATQRPRLAALDVPTQGPSNWNCSTSPNSSPKAGDTRERARAYADALKGHRSLPASRDNTPKRAQPGRSTAWQLAASLPGTPREQQRSRGQLQRQTSSQQRRMYDFEHDQQPPWPRSPSRSPNKPLTGWETDQGGDEGWRPERPPRAERAADLPRAGSHDSAEPAAASTSQASNGRVLQTRVSLKALLSAGPADEAANGATTHRQRGIDSRSRMPQEARDKAVSARGAVLYDVHAEHGPVMSTSAPRRLPSPAQLRRPWGASPSARASPPRTASAERMFAAPEIAQQPARVSRADMAGNVIGPPASGSRQASMSATWHSEYTSSPRSISANRLSRTAAAPQPPARLRISPAPAYRPPWGSGVNSPRIDLSLTSGSDSPFRTAPGGSSKRARSPRHRSPARSIRAGSGPPANDTAQYNTATTDAVPNANAQPVHSRTSLQELLALTGRQDAGSQSAAAHRAASLPSGASGPSHAASDGIFSNGTTQITGRSRLSQAGLPSVGSAPAASGGSFNLVAPPMFEWQVPVNASSTQAAGAGSSDAAPSRSKTIPAGVLAVPVDLEPSGQSDKSLSAPAAPAISQASSAESSDLTSPADSGRSSGKKRSSWLHFFQRPRSMSRDSAASKPSVVKSSLSVTSHAIDLQATAESALSRSPASYSHCDRGTLQLSGPVLVFPQKPDCGTLSVPDPAAPVATASTPPPPPPATAAGQTGRAPYATLGPQSDAAGTPSPVRMSPSAQFSTSGTVLPYGQAHASASRGSGQPTAAAVKVADNAVADAGHVCMAAGPSAQNAAAANQPDRVASAAELSSLEAALRAGLVLNLAAMATSQPDPSQDAARPAAPSARVDGHAAADSSNSMPITTAGYGSVVEAADSAAAAQHASSAQLAQQRGQPASDAERPSATAPLSGASTPRSHEAGPALMQSAASSASPQKRQRRLPLHKQPWSKPAAAAKPPSRPSAAAASEPRTIDAASGFVHIADIEQPQLELPTHTLISHAAAEAASSAVHPPAQQSAGADSSMSEQPAQAGLVQSFDHSKLEPMVHEPTASPLCEAVTDGATTARSSSSPPGSATPAAGFHALHANSHISTSDCADAEIPEAQEQQATADLPAVSGTDAGPPPHSLSTACDPVEPASSNTEAVGEPTAHSIQDLDARSFAPATTRQSPQHHPAASLLQHVHIGQPDTSSMTSSSAQPPATAIQESYSAQHEVQHAPSQSTADAQAADSWQPRQASPLAAECTDSPTHSSGNPASASPRERSAALAAQEAMHQTVEAASLPLSVALLADSASADSAGAGLHVEQRLLEQPGAQPASILAARDAAHGSPHPQCMHEPSSDRLQDAKEHASAASPGSLAAEPALEAVGGYASPAAIPSVQAHSASAEETTSSAQPPADAMNPVPNAAASGTSASLAEGVPGSTSSQAHDSMSRHAEQAAAEVSDAQLGAQAHAHAAASVDQAPEPPTVSSSPQRQPESWDEAPTDAAHLQPAAMAEVPARDSRATDGLHASTAPDMAAAPSPSQQPQGPTVNSQQGALVPSPQPKRKPEAVFSGKGNRPTQAADKLMSEHPIGSVLLRDCPDVGRMTGEQLLAALAQGSEMHKAWEQGSGGSTRVMQCTLVARTVYLAYSSGWRRKAMKHAVDRVHVPTGAWQPGKTITVDTDKGTIGLVPPTAREYAVWVCGLNAMVTAARGGPEGNVSVTPAQNMLWSRNLFEMM